LSIDLGTLPIRLRDDSEFLATQKIIFDGWSDLGNAAHYFFQRCGSRGDGIIFDPMWERSSNTASVYSSSDSYDLHDFSLESWPIRKVENSGLTYGYILEAYGNNIDLSIDTFDESGGSVHSVTLEMPVWDWHTAVLFTGEDYLRYELEAARKEASGTGYIAQIALNELIVTTASQIPTTAWTE
jgi:hypothetical protein